MTGKEAIAMLKRMQEPEAWEPQINEAAFEALEMAIKALEGEDTNVPSRKGIFIPDITMEMFRNASLEGVEELMASGEMEDISLPSAQLQYKPVTAEDFAKTMSENSPYNFVAWHQEALTLMKKQGFVICKKMM